MNRAVGGVMLAAAATELPVGAWAYEAKLDGFRAIGVIDKSSRTRLLSRQNRRLDGYFPEIGAALADLPDGTVLDGELVMVRDGGVDFAALQRRLNPSARRARQLSASSPAALVAFDLLAVAGQDLRGRTYDDRRLALTHLLAAAAPPLGLMPMTVDAAAARTWLTGTPPGVEGVVANRRAQRYRAGVRGWRKIRSRTTSEAIVGGVFGRRDDPAALILGLPHVLGGLHVVGRTATLSAAARRLIGPLLSPAGDSHPWPQEIPGWRLGAFDHGRTAYTRVAPSLVVELETDYAFEHGRWRHPTRFIRLRPDLEPDDLLSIPDASSARRDRRSPRDT